MATKKKTAAKPKAQANWLKSEILQVTPALARRAWLQFLTKEEQQALLQIRAEKHQGIEPLSRYSERQLADIILAKLPHITCKTTTLRLWLKTPPEGESNG